MHVHTDVFLRLSSWGKRVLGFVNGYLYKHFSKLLFKINTLKTIRFGDLIFCVIRCHVLTTIDYKKEPKHDID